MYCWYNCVWSFFALCARMVCFLLLFTTFMWLPLAVSVVHFLVNSRDTLFVYGRFWRKITDIQTRGEKYYWTHARSDWNKHQKIVKFRSTLKNPALILGSVSGLVIGHLGWRQQPKITNVIYFEAIPTQSLSRIPPSLGQSSTWTCFWKPWMQWNVLFTFSNRTSNGFNSISVAFINSHSKVIKRSSMVTFVFSSSIVVTS